MTTYVVLGDRPVAPKLLTATMNDYLDTHFEVTPEDDFIVVVATRKKISPSLLATIQWCQKAGVYHEVITAPGANLPEDHEADEHLESASFLIDAVEKGYEYSRSGAVVLALVGELEPKVDVARALVRAADSHMVIRDLTEGALTYIKFHGDTVDLPPTEEEEMPAAETEEVTLEDLVALATEGDEEAVEALDEAARELGIDPDEYETWEEVGVLVGEAMEAAEEEEEEEEPEEEEEAEPSGGWTAEALKDKTLKEVREIGVAAGIEGAKAMPRVKLLDALTKGTSPEEEAPAPVKKKAAAKKTAAKVEPEEEVESLPQIDTHLMAEMIAELVVEKIIARIK